MAVKGIAFYKLLDNYNEKNPEYNQKLENPSPGKSFMLSWMGNKEHNYFKRIFDRKDNKNSYKNKYLNINLLSNMDEEDDFEYELKFLADEELNINNRQEKLWFRIGKILTYNEIPTISDIDANLNI